MSKVMEKTSMEPSQVYIAEVKGTGAAADLDLAGDKIPAGKVVRVEAMYVVDLTTVNRSCRIGYQRGGSQYWFKRQNAGASAFAVNLDGSLHLVGGEQPIGRVESAPSGDECWLIVRGVYV